MQRRSGLRGDPVAAGELRGERGQRLHARIVVALAPGDRQHGGVGVDEGDRDHASKHALDNTCIRERHRRERKLMTPLDAEAETTLFFAGEAVIELHRTETTNYRNNLASATPALWVIMRPTASDPPYELLAVTADPAEGEASTDAGNNLVEAVPMPEAIRGAIENFIAEHHVEREFVKRKQSRADPEALARRDHEGEHE